MIDDTNQPLDIMKLNPKSQSLHIEFMFAHSMFQATYVDEQNHLLNCCQSYIQTTVGKTRGPLLPSFNIKGFDTFYPVQAK